MPKTTHQAGSGYQIGGMGKGAAMLAPALATMLVVLTTDADLPPADLDTALREAVRTTFDRLDTDGCMSTNDTVLLLASGASGHQAGPGEFTGLLTAACADLATPDAGRRRGREQGHHDRGRPARPASRTRSRSAAPSRAATCSSARSTARTRTGAGCWRLSAPPAPRFEPDELSVAINGVWVCKDGAPGEDRSAVDLRPREVTITVDLAAGPHSATIKTTDLTAEYVHENSAYST